MAQKNFIHVGETGKTMLVDSEIDLTDATELEIRFQKPDGTTRKQSQL